MRKEKRKGTGLEFRVFTGHDKQRHLVFRSPKNSFHSFIEVEAKQAARECGAAEGANTRQMWKSLWDQPG